MTFESHSEPSKQFLDQVISKHTPVAAAAGVIVTVTELEFTLAIHGDQPMAAQPGSLSDTA